MTIFPEFERQLQELGRRRVLEDQSTAVRRSGRTRLSGVRWSPRLSRPWASVAIVAIALIVGGAFLLTLHGAKRGAPATHGGGAPPPHAWTSAAATATEQTQQRDASCRLHMTREPPGKERFLSGAPDRGLASIMGVFRTPAPPGQAVSEGTLRGLQLGGWGIYARYARHAVRYGVSYYLVPVVPLPGQGLSAQCTAEMLTAFREQVHYLSRSERAAAVNWFSRRLRYERPKPGVCLVTRSTLMLSMVCQGTADVAANGRRSPGGTVGSRGHYGTETEMVLPDSVASVTADYPAEHRYGDVPHPITVTHRVVGNVVVFKLSGAFDPPALTARSSSGQVLWRTTLPPNHNK